MEKMIRGALFMACALAACGCGAGRRGESEPKAIVLGYSQLGDESTWRTRNSLSITEAAKEAGIKIMFEDAMQIRRTRSRLSVPHRVQSGCHAFSPVVETAGTPCGRGKKPASRDHRDRMIYPADDSLYACASVRISIWRAAGRRVLGEVSDSGGPIKIVRSRHRVLHPRIGGPKDSGTSSPPIPNSR
jgi:simple sugar transport system substrate-binding protein